MIELFEAELRRFARWALGLGMLHTAALFLLDRTFPWRDDGEIAFAAGSLYALAGATFGFYQCASYARMNHWIALLHRPLAAWRIMAAVCGASATVMYAAVSVPLLVFTAGLTMQAGRVVDARHWPLALGGGLFAVIGLAIGGYLALAPRRYGWTALVAASVLIINRSDAGAAVLLLPLLVLATLVLLLAGAFKPDRSSPPSKPALLAVTAGVAALSLYFLLVVGSGVAYQLGLAAVGRNAEIDAPPASGLVEAWHAPSRDLLADALAAAPGREAATLRRRVQGVEATRLPVARDDLPTRGELTNSGAIAFTEAEKGVRWTYSHDANALKGVRVMDRRAVGILRPAGGFETPPVPLGNEGMIAGGSFFRLDPRSGTLERRLQLSAGERIVARPVATGAFMAVLSDKALYFLDPNALEGGRQASATVTVPLLGMVGDLQRLDVAHLTDRTIVSLFFGDDSIEGPYEGWQRLVSVAPDGTVTTLAERSLGPEHSNALRFRAYWLSPAIEAIASGARRIGTRSAWAPPRAPVNVPSGIWIAAGLLSLAAAAAAAFVAVRRRLETCEIVGWTLAALVFGSPMFVAFCLIRERSRLTT